MAGGGLFLLCFNSVSCTKDAPVENETKDLSQLDARFDENNYTFNTIDLWGSEAAVVDCGDYYLFQGDIRLSKEDLQNSQTRGAGRIDSKWPDNKVYFELNNVPSNYIEQVYAAIFEIESHSYLTFVPRWEESSYIRINFIDSDVKFAQSDYIGRKGGLQNLDISRAAWDSGTIVHELCHAIGMYHEMCRADRDNYVNIDFSGMSDKERHQYKKYSELGHNGRDFAEFDFNSIMMYPSWLGAKVVMTKKDGSTFWPQQEKLTGADATTLAGIQPAMHYTFYNPHGYNEPVFNKYKCIAVKFLRCPERTSIRFRFQHRFAPDKSIWGKYTAADFDIKVTVRATDNAFVPTPPIYKPIYYFNQSIPITETTTYQDLLLPVVTLPQRFYDLELALSGYVKGESTSDKLYVLENLMKRISVYLHLDKVIINNQSIPIPSAFGNPSELRNQTFIQI